MNADAGFESSSAPRCRADPGSSRGVPILEVFSKSKLGRRETPRVRLGVSIDKWACALDPWVVFGPAPAATRAQGLARSGRAWLYAPASKPTSVDRRAADVRSAHDGVLVRGRGTRPRYFHSRPKLNANAISYGLDFIVFPSFYTVVSVFFSLVGVWIALRPAPERR